MKKILYLSHCCPFPPNKGEKIRAYHEIIHLARHCEVHLACLTRDREELKYYDDLASFCSSVKILPFNERWAKISSLPYLATPLPLSVPFFYHHELQDYIDSLFNQETFDAILCFSSPMAEYVFRARKSSRNWQLNGRRPQLIMDFCDLDSDKWCQYASSSAWPLSAVYSREGRELLAYEYRINRIFDHSVFISKPEIDLFQRLRPKAEKLTVIPNGVDFDYFRPGVVTPAPLAEIAPSAGPVLLFTGAMDYQANVDGVLWFTEKIYPLIKQAMPEVHFFIVGSRPLPKIEKLNGRDDITVTGFVDDIRPYQEAATMVVVPLRQARGVQNKILEAMAMKKAVVTTSQALEGTEAQPGRDVMLADEPEIFARQVVELLQRPEKQAQLGSQGRQFVKQHHNWDDNMNKLEHLIDLADQVSAVSQ